MRFTKTDKRNATGCVAFFQLVAPPISFINFALCFNKHIEIWPGSNTHIG